MPVMHRRALDRALAYVDSWLRYRHEGSDIPGYVVAVAHEGKIVLEQGYGEADLAAEAPMTPAHIFRIASHSKTFTATAVLQLAEAGALRLDDLVVDHLSWLGGHRDRRVRRVTIRQLLCHGAGMVRDGTRADFWQLLADFPDVGTLKNEVLESLLVTEPNVALKYSNIGYSLLGLVVEAASGESYEDYVSDRIVGPLGLERTGPDHSDGLEGSLATGYGRADVYRTRLPIASVGTGAMAPATGFYGSAADLCTYFSAQMVGSKLLLSDDSKREMQRVHWHARGTGPGTQGDYGLGLGLDTVGTRRTFGHGGAYPGHITRTMVDPEEGLVVVVLTNCIDGPAEEMARGIFGIIDYFAEHVPPGRPKEDMLWMQGRYMNLWAVSDIVVTGDRIIRVSPTSWAPLADPERLEAVDAQTLRIADTGSFASAGELVRLQLRDGEMESLDYAGMTMWPEEAWIDRQLDRLSVHLG
jgi:D-alanyl-D-alanine carboxypeptidase